MLFLNAMLPGLVARCLGAPVNGGLFVHALIPLCTLLSQLLHYIRLGSTDEKKTIDARTGTSGEYLFEDNRYQIKDEPPHVGDGTPWAQNGRLSIQQ